MGHAPEWMRGSMKKSAPSHAATGVRQHPIFHTAQGYADGGEVREGSHRNISDDVRARAAQAMETNLTAQNYNPSYTNQEPVAKAMPVQAPTKITVTKIEPVAVVAPAPRAAKGNDFVPMHSEDKGSYPKYSGRGYEEPLHDEAEGSYPQTQRERKERRLRVDKAAGKVFNFLRGPTDPQNTGTLRRSRAEPTE